MLWRVDELAEMGAGYDVAEFAPDLFLFGSNGGGEALRVRQPFVPPPIVAVPFIGMELCDAIPIATDFRTFLEVLSNSEIPFSHEASGELEWTT